MKGSGEQTGDGLVEGSTPEKKREQREQRMGGDDGEPGRGTPVRNGSFTNQFRLSHHKKVNKC